MRSEDLGQSDYRASEASALGVKLLVDSTAGNGQLPRVCETDDKCSAGL